jgi:hypothetical protein
VRVLLSTTATATACCGSVPSSPRPALPSGSPPEAASSRWSTLAELDASTDELVPRDLAARLRALLADGPPSAPVAIGV